MRVDIWTDGSCWPNPGPGGWAAILESGEHRKEMSGPLPETTNIRAELTAVINALGALRGGPYRVIIHTDSQYVCGAIDGMQNPKANLDLLEELERAETGHLITADWLRGHTGNANNERCDQLALEARLSLQETNTR